MPISEEQWGDTRNVSRREPHEGETTLYFRSLDNWVSSYIRVQPVDATEPLFQALYSDATAVGAEKIDSIEVGCTNDQDWPITAVKKTKMMKS
jgi:hypothetical protein